MKKSILFIVLVFLMFKIYSIDVEKDFIKVDGGTFIMGAKGPDASTAEHWPHKVQISDYKISKFEVTNGQFVEVYNWAIDKGYVYVERKNGYIGLFLESSYELMGFIGQYGDYPKIDFKDGKFTIDESFINYPVVRMAWYAAAGYCNFLSEMNGLTPCYDIYLEEWDSNANGYRLPTEAEWEYAARSRGKDYTYSWGNTLKPTENIADLTLQRSMSKAFVWEKYKDGWVYTAPVGSMTPNEIGLYDMTGNVNEYCWNVWEYYPGEESDKVFINPKGPDFFKNATRTYRGGSWYDNNVGLRTTSRSFIQPDYISVVSDNGFRIAQNR